MDAIQFLKQQHEEAKRMFGRIEQAAAGDRGQLWSKLRPKLEAHEQMEERYLYGPVADDAGDTDSVLAEWEQEHSDEVTEAESMIHRINGLNPSDEGWLTHVKELRSALEQHIEQEEGTIWPRIRRVWDAPKLEQAGRQMEAMKGKADRAA